MACTSKPPVSHPRKSLCPVVCVVGAFRSDMSLRSAPSGGVGRVLRAAAAMLLVACVACSAREENALLGNTRVLKLEGSTVTALGIYLSGDDGERILELLSSPGVARLNIGYVPGGLAVVGFKLSNVLAGKNVVITGPCASACANGVINAASVSFAKAQLGEMPPMLAFHGLFAQAGDRIENATKASKLYAQRMRVGPLLTRVPQPRGATRLDELL